MPLEPHSICDHVVQTQRVCWRLHYHAYAQTPRSWNDQCLDGSSHYGGSKHMRCMVSSNGTACKLSSWVNWKMHFLYSSSLRSCTFSLEDNRSHIRKCRGLVARSNYLTQICSVSLCPKSTLHWWRSTSVHSPCHNTLILGALRAYTICCCDTMLYIDRACERMHLCFSSTLLASHFMHSFPHLLRSVSSFHRSWHIIKAVNA